MHPLFADARKLAWYLAAWLLAGGLVAGTLHLTGMAGWAKALLFALPVALVYAFVALSAYYVCRSMPYPQRRWGLAIGVFGGASLLSAFAWLALGGAWNAVGGLIGLDGDLVAMHEHAWVMFFAAGFGFYLLSALAHDVLIAFETVQAAAQREAQSRVLAREAELQVLRTQINPHFLFNSLNSISALTGFDPSAARDMTIDLAQLFRSTLSLSAREKITVAEEVALCERFLAIERRRFGTKLAYVLHVDPTAETAALPPMSLQPLLENAIKHGIRHLDDGGEIVVRASTRDGWLHLSVDNPVAADAAPSPGTGLGLRNIRERLSSLYGERARIVWRTENGHFTVELALPNEPVGQA